jgi:glycosyltransferase involved in cell wall biosynthesis
MACGVPVVGSKIGGLPEVVGSDGGILCPVGDVEAMGLAALSILDELSAWRQRSRQRAHKFSEDQWVDEYEKIYTQIVQG